MKKISVFVMLLCSGILLTGQTPKDMVLIEGGSFMMGIEGSVHDGPSHMVELNSFYMDIHEVTNAEYLEFCEATQNRLPEFWGVDKYKSGEKFPNYPVVGISSEDARRYADWAGKRIPTEAEWEYAGRGGLVGQKFPNGMTISSEEARINSRAFESGPVPVMSFPPNGFGLYDMAGNVWEWVSDWFSEEYYQNSPISNPGGPATGWFKVIRGGGWHSGPGCNGVGYRNAIPQHWVDIAGGFRCVKDME